MISLLCFNVPLFRNKIYNKLTAHTINRFKTKRGENYCRKKLESLQTPPPFYLRHLDSRFGGFTYCCSDIFSCAFHCEENQKIEVKSEYFYFLFLVWNCQNQFPR